MLGSLVTHGTALALALALHSSAPSCEPHRITGYSVTDFPGLTADGTSTVGALARGEPIAAASYNWPLGSYISVEGLGVYRVADRGFLDARHIDILVPSRAAAYALTSTRMVCPFSMDDE